MKNSEYIIALCDDSVASYFDLLNLYRGNRTIPQPTAREIWQLSCKKVAKEYGFDKKDCELWAQVCESWYDCYLSNKLSDD